MTPLSLFLFILASGLGLFCVALLALIMYALYLGFLGWARSEDESRRTRRIKR